MKPKRATFWVLLLLVTFAGWDAALPYSGGDGSAANPYEISSANDLLDLMNTPGDWGANFVLTANIEASGIGSPVPVGNPAQPFTGTLDGKGFVISNLNINLPLTDFVGLFGYIHESSTVQNLGLADGAMQGRFYVGGFCGYNQGNVVNCYATGDVSATGDTAGGFCGINIEEGRITHCYATGNVTTEGFRAGGFCGYNFGAISNCRSEGDASAGRGSAGGFCADIMAGTISNCYATGNADATEDAAGGFCGHQFGIVSASYSTGNATAGGNAAGGFCGVNYGNLYTSYATGNAVAGGDQAGGFCGFNLAGWITDCFSTGNAHADNDFAGGFCGATTSGYFVHSYSIGRPSTPGAFAGGFSGAQNSDTYNGVFWDVQTSGQTAGFGDGFSSPNVQGADTAAMRRQQTFDNAGWDFSNVWAILEGVTYPYLRALPNPYPVPSPVQHAVDVSVPTLNNIGAVVFLFLIMAAMKLIRRKKE